MAWLLLFVRIHLRAPAGTLTMNVTWKVNHDVASGTKFTNKVPELLTAAALRLIPPDVVTFTPETDKHWTNDNDQSVDNMVFIAVIM